MIDWSKYDMWKLDSPPEYPCDYCGEYDNWSEHGDWICACGWNNEKQKWCDPNDSTNQVNSQDEDTKIQKETDI